MKLRLQILKERLTVTAVRDENYFVWTFMRQQFPCHLFSVCVSRVPDQPSVLFH